METRMPFEWERSGDRFIIRDSEGLEQISGYYETYMLYEIAALRDKLKEVEGERDKAEQKIINLRHGYYELERERNVAYRKGFTEGQNVLRGHYNDWYRPEHVDKIVADKDAALAEMTERARKYRVALFKTGCNDIFCAEFERDCGKCQTIAREVVKE